MPPALVRCTPSSATPRRRQPAGDHQVDSPCPTHVLAISFQDDSRGRLVPIHGLCWALEVPSLAEASRSPPHDDGARRDSRCADLRQLNLPVLPLRLPHARAFPIIHEWPYLGSPLALLRHFLVPPTQRPPAQGLADATEPSPEKGHSEGIGYPASSAEIMDRLYLLHTVRETAVALELSSEALWQALALGWNRLVVAGAAANMRERLV